MSRLVDRIRREEDMKNPTPPSDIPPVPGMKEKIAAEVVLVEGSLARRRWLLEVQCICCVDPLKLPDQGMCRYCDEHAHALNLDGSGYTSCGLPA